MQEKRADVCGIAMRWFEQGQGTPVVLIHGIPTCPALWRHVVPLIPGARCLAWEMVGYGASIPAGLRTEISVSAQADHLLAWLDSLGLDRVILAGHDLGGGVAQIAAVRRPERVSGLFLTNAIGYNSWPIPSVKVMRASGPLVRHLPDVAIRQVIRTLMIRGHDNPDRARESLDSHWPNYERNGAADALVRQVSALDVRDTLDVADRLPTLSVPARIVWGAADQFQKIRYGERFASDLKAPLRRIDGGKHFTPEDHPEIIAEEIQSLVQSVSS